VEEEELLRSALLVDTEPAITAVAAVVLGLMMSAVMVLQTPQGTVVMARLEQPIVIAAKVMVTEGAEVVPQLVEVGLAPARPCPMVDMEEVALPIKMELMHQCCLVAAAVLPAVL
jgi:hypothetical protein